MLGLARKKEKKSNEEEGNGRGKESRHRITMADEELGPFVEFPYLTSTLRGITHDKRDVGSHHCRQVSYLWRESSTTTNTDPVPP